MKITITLFENNFSTCLVKSSIDIKNDVIKLVKDKEEEVKIGLAKMCFGDWENQTLAEKNRQISQNIHLFDVEIVTKKPQKSILKEEKGLTLETKEREVEFGILNGLNGEKPEIRICTKKTKAGNPCKGKAIEGSSFCMAHQE